MRVRTRFLVKSSEYKTKSLRNEIAASRVRLKIQDSRHDAGSVCVYRVPKDTPPFNVGGNDTRKCSEGEDGAGEGGDLGGGGAGGVWKTKCKLCLLERMSTPVKASRLAGETGCQHFPIQRHQRWGVDGEMGVRGSWGDAVCLSVCLLLALAIS